MNVNEGMEGVMGGRCMGDIGAGGYPEIDGLGRLIGPGGTREVDVPEVVEVEGPAVPAVPFDGLLEPTFPETEEFCGAVGGDGGWCCHAE